MDTEHLNVIRDRAEAATPGPWGWFGNLKADGPYLATVHGGRRFVMQFARLGMQSAQPRFQVYDPEHDWGYMVDGRDLAIYEADHRADIVGFDNPDAEFIAHARQDVADLLAEVDQLRGAIDRLAWFEVEQTYHPEGADLWWQHHVDMDPVERAAEAYGLDGMIAT